MNESQYQGKLIKKIRKQLPDCTVLKNDANYMQGIPDLSIFLGSKYAYLEVKISKDAEHQPNQDYYINKTNQTGGFGRFIFPENEKEVLDEMYNFLNN